MEIKPSYIQISPLLGEIHWKENPSDSQLSMQLGWCDFLQRELGDQILDLRQGFTSVSILWKDVVAHSQFQNKLNTITIRPHELSNKIWKVPVCYGEGFGKDLDTLAKEKKLKVGELIEMHASVAYRIHFFGFLPGFMYLNGLPERLHSPRKAVPDRAVPRGSVAIGGSQTGIYPRESPGGWHVIGRTPISLFDGEQNPPVWANPGDRIKFVPISSSEMERLIENPPLPNYK